VGEIRGGVATGYVPDTQGSCIATVSGGVVTSTTDYYPYGEVASSTGTNPSPWGYIGLLGYFKDALNRLYVRARYLRNDLARWLTKDPLWPGQKAFGYVANLPTQYTDATGMALNLPCLKAAVVGFLVGLALCTLGWCLGCLVGGAGLCLGSGPGFPGCIVGVLQACWAFVCGEAVYACYSALLAATITIIVRCLSTPLPDPPPPTPMSRYDKCVNQCTYKNCYNLTGKDFRLCFREQKMFCSQPNYSC
jgi:RHS repeat-associated protein